MYIFKCYIIEKRMIVNYVFVNMVYNYYVMWGMMVVIFIEIGGNGFML